MKAVSVLIKFGADGRVTSYPVLDVDEDAVVLAQRLARWAATAVENPASIACLVGWHEHPAGTCR